MIVQELKSTTNPVLPNIYEKYYGISQNFHHSKTIPEWFDFNLFMYEVGDAAIEEALVQPKKYGPDGRFYNLLRFRYTDFLRKHQPGNITSIEQNDDAIESKFTTTPNLQICFNKAIALVDELLQQADQFTEGQIATKFIDLANQFNITHFFGIKIDDIEAICKMQGKTRQNRSDHRRKFKLLIANINVKSTSRVELDESKDYEGVDKEAILFFEKGLQYRYEAKEFENKNCLKADMNTFFKCFLSYLKASFCFKKATEIDANFHVNRYNYAYVLKRLGFFADAIVELNELCLIDLPKQKKAMVLECLGNTYSLEIDSKKAINCFETALKLSPHDTEIMFNLLEEYDKDENEHKIIDLLKLLIKTNQTINNQSHLMLLNKLATTKNSKIIELTSTIKNLK